VPFDRRVWLEATALRAAGYLVTVICPKGEKDQQEDFQRLADINIYRYELPATSTGFVAYFREYTVAMACTLRLAIRVLVRDGFDIIHACNPPDLFFLIGLIFKLAGKKFVFDQHDLSPETFDVQFRGRYRSVYWGLRALEWLTYRTADVVIATNESIRDIAHRRGGVPGERLFVVRTGPDFDRLHSVPPEPALKRGRAFLVAYVGVMGRQDGVDLALRAAQQIVQVRGRVDVQFAFIGKGDHTETLRRLSSELGLDGCVEFTGRVSDADLIRYLSTADVCLSPDPANGLNEYHTMNKTMEYMAMGKPVVAFDIRETRYSAQDAAVYARPNDVGQFADLVVMLLDDPELRGKLAATGRTRIEQTLQWDHSKPALLEAYARLADRARNLRRSVAGNMGEVEAVSAARALKRAMDLVGSAVLLLLASPFLLAIGVLVKVTSPGPVLYQWNVVGQGGRPFTGYKFRSMVINADQLKNELLAKNEMSGPVFKIRDDPRITPIGKTLRKYSLDELPQLWSVLKGDMSLVGPRPPLQTEYAQFTEWQKQKVAVRPGVTCLWQVSGRNTIRDFDDWVRLDLDYINNWSLWLDLTILLRTVWAVLRARGAS
jgi:lipopolysaccharide/colanic/teichoic acid biosynthesis glycosyltransferase/glycosyltransferase involved in cell wall biosynthesis